jgi:hypothetical protein
MSMDSIVEGNDAVSEAPDAADALVTDPSPAEAPAAPEDNWATRTPEDMREEIEKLRRESATKRVRYAPYEKAFDGMNPNDAREIIELAQAVKTWDEATIKGKVGAWAAQFGLTAAEAKEVVAEATDDGDEPLTKAGLAEALKNFQRDQQAAQAAQATERQKRERADEIRQHVKSLGYDPEKDRRAHSALYGIAHDLMEASHNTLDAKVALDQAHEALDGWRTQVIDEYRSSKTRDAGRVSTPSGVGGTPTKDNTPTNLDEATARAKSRVAAAIK